MFLNTFKYTLKREVRDRVSMFLMVIFPILLAFIVGNALKSEFEVITFDKAKIAVVNLDKGEASSSFTEILAADEVQSFVTINTDIDTVEEAKYAYDQVEIDGYILIGEDYTNNLIDSDALPCEIELYKTGNNAESMEIVKQIIDEYNLRMEVLSSDTLSNEDLEYIDQAFSKDFISSSSLNNNQNPTSMDYYGVTFIVLVCMFGSLYNIKVVSDIMYGKFRDRFKSIKSNELYLYLGTGLSSFLLVSVQILVLILFFKYAYGVYLGENIFKLFLITELFILLTNIFGTALITVFKRYSISYTVAYIFIFGTTFLSSGFVILNLGNGRLNYIVENILPNAVCQNMLFSVIYDTQSIDLFQSTLVILIWIAALLGIIYLAKRRENKCLY